MKHRKRLLLPLIALLICIPAISAQAQNPPPPRYGDMDDEFINALVMAAVNDNILEGKNEIGELRDLREIVTNYYDRKLNSPFISDKNFDSLKDKRNTHLDMIAKKISVTTNPEHVVWLFLVWFTSQDQVNRLQEEMGIPHFVADNDNPPPEYLNTMNKSVSSNLEANANTALEMNTIRHHPELAPTGNDSSGWSYNIPEITDSTDSISPPSDDEPTPTEADSESSPTDSAPPPDAPGDGSTNSGITEKRPVAFRNDGWDAATIRPYTYTPPDGGNAAIPIASTVVDPYSNSSAYLELPLGTYTFCYHWDIGQDIDDDGYADYNHNISASFTLTANASQNMENAVTVSFSAPGNAAKRGKCGQQFEAYTNLTPQEAASVGMHTYQMSRTTTDGTTETWTEQREYQFSSSGVNLIMPDLGFVGYYARTEPNEYLLANSNDVTKLTFTKEGIIYVTDAEGGWTSIGIRID